MIFLVEEQTTLQPSKIHKANVLDGELPSAFSFASLLETLSKKEELDEALHMQIPRKKAEKPNSNTKDDSLLTELLKTNTKNEPTRLQSSPIKELQTLLKEDPLEEAAFVLNPTVSTKLSTKELKYLIYKAKRYLKQKIETHPVFLAQKAKKELPKTLKGLLVLANKLKIEISKITVEHLVQNEKEIPPTQNRRFALRTNKLQIQTIDTEKTPKNDTSTLLEPQMDALEALLKPKNEKGSPSPLKAQPLFQQKTKNTHIPMTTGEIITSKKPEKNVQNKHSTPLSQLLRTNDARSSIQTNDTAAKQAEIKMQQTNTPLRNIETKTEEPMRQKETLAFEKLLSGENTHKQEGITHTLSKSDSLEVKVHEAKQMMRYLSSDIKQAIEEYKPPFSRIKVKLNPQKLGELDMTVVQRGNNVHINLSSNNAALTLLNSNLTELKTHLQQNGIDNASFSFNSQQQNSQENRQQRKNEHYKKYKEFQNDTAEEIRSLEIVIPRYI